MWRFGSVAAESQQIHQTVEAEVTVVVRLPENRGSWKPERTQAIKWTAEGVGEYRSGMWLIAYDVVTHVSC